VVVPFTANETLQDAERLPDVAVIDRMAVLVGAVFEAVTVSVVVPLEESDVEEKAAVTPVGSPVMLNLVALLRLVRVRVNLSVVLLPAESESAVVAELR
jgi:hypothetical protein